MARRSTPGFPELPEQLDDSVQQSVRQYLIEGSELFAVHRYPLARSSYTKRRNSWPVGRPQIFPSCQSNSMILFSSI